MNILEAKEILSGKKSVRPFSLPPVGAAPLIAPAGPATAPAAASAPVIPSEQKKRGPVGEFFHDVGQTARAVGTGLYSAFADRLPDRLQQQHWTATMLRLERAVRRKDILQNRMKT